jgi:prepilin-type N-terminal cleavage/methylation domain-containing protein/prepilin-type processing-associated H-X9-DG protein
MTFRFSKARGFTLIELLVVVAIISLLIAILLPSLSKARETARKAACLANLHAFGTAFYTYADTNRDQLPNGNPPGFVSPPWGDPTGTNALFVAFSHETFNSTAYVTSAKLFRCPSDRDPVPDDITTADYGVPNSARMSYDYFSVGVTPEKGPFLRLMLDGKAPMMWDMDGKDPKSPYQNHQNGGNVLFAGGHAEWQPAVEWDGSNQPHPFGQAWALLYP